jgi:uncharacterized protein YdcH (DUF465 family)
MPTPRYVRNVKAEWPTTGHVLAEHNSLLDKIKDRDDAILRLREEVEQLRSQRRRHPNVRTER